MRHVAEEAGVSPALVSIVFRDAPGASEGTRRRVREAADRIGYVVDERARLLRRSRSQDVGIVFQTGQPFHQQLIDELYTAVEAAGGTVILSGTSTTRDERAALAGLVAYRPGAIVLLGTELDEEALRALAGDIPLVSLARPLGEGTAWVASDDAAALTLAVDHLAERGHREVLFATASGAAGEPQRREAFTAAADRHGLAARVEEGGTTERSGAALAARLLDAGSLPGAVIAFNDRSALGLLHVLALRGIAVPDQIAVVGIDDSEIASRDHVDLTSVAQDTAGLAAAAAELAREAMDRRGRPGPATAGHRVLPVHLVVRGSA